MARFIDTDGDTWEERPNGRLVLIICDGVHQPAGDRPGLDREEVEAEVGPLTVA